MSPGISSCSSPRGCFSAGLKQLPLARCNAVSCTITQLFKLVFDTSCLPELFKAIKAQAPPHLWHSTWALQACLPRAGSSPGQLEAPALPSRRRAAAASGSPAPRAAWGCRTGCPAPGQRPERAHRHWGDDPARERGQGCGAGPRAGQPGFGLLVPHFLTPNVPNPHRCPSASQSLHV